MLAFIGLLLFMARAQAAYEDQECGHLGKGFLNRNNGRFKRSMIMGGNEINVNEVPFVVRIDNFGQHHCTGTLLSDRLVLTGAHCFTTDECRKNFCQIGYSVCHLIDNNNEPCPQNQTFRVKNFHFLDQFVENKCEPQLDFVVLELQKPIEEAVPVCLPSETSSEHLNIVEVSLLGYSNNLDLPSGTQFWTNKFLRYVDIEEVSNDENFIYTAFNEETAVCGGDSGGPMIQVNDGKAFIVGINNYAFGRCLIDVVKKDTEDALQISVNVQKHLNDITSLMEKVEEDSEEKDDGVHNGTGSIGTLASIGHAEMESKDGQVEENEHADNDEETEEGDKTEEDEEEEDDDDDDVEEEGEAEEAEKQNEDKDNSSEDGDDKDDEDVEEAEEDVGEEEEEDDGDD